MGGSWTSARPDDHARAAVGAAAPVHPARAAERRGGLLAATSSDRTSAVAGPSARLRSPRPRPGVPCASAAPLSRSTAHVAIHVAVRSAQTGVRAAPSRRSLNTSTSIPLRFRASPLESWSDSVDIAQASEMAAPEIGSAVRSILSRAACGPKKRAKNGRWLWRFAALCWRRSGQSTRLVRADMTRRIGSTMRLNVFQVQDTQSTVTHADLDYEGSVHHRL